MSTDIQVQEQILIEDVKRIIEEGKKQVASLVNASLTTTNWNVGKRIKQDILKDKRASYGKEIIAKVSKALTFTFGSGWTPSQLRHCIRIYDVFPDFNELTGLIKVISWTHFRSLIYLKSKIEIDFYTYMCRLEGWDTRTLQKKIDSMLFERTSISKKPEKLIKKELQKLKNDNILTPDLVFKDHYILDYLNLKDTYSEKDLEQSILRDIENFLLELGIGFTFVARQKRMVIDYNDFYLDLLLYNRKLNRLVAIDLKLGKFKASYKGQMELYLRYLEKYEIEKNEEPPIGLILCSSGNSEQIELLQLDGSNIKVAEYITKNIPQNILLEKIKKFKSSAKLIIDNKIEESKKKK
jgi:predicted nuclease of restriction endonuclease-like (RecB) superfamily